MSTGISWLDVRLGLRMLAKHPALTLVGGLGMAVGVAVSVAFFAFFAANFLPDIPLPEGDRIVALENRDVEVNNEERRAFHDFVQWRAELRTVRELGAFRMATRTLVAGDAVPEVVPVAEITAAGFTVPRVPPALGRPLLPADERPGAPSVLVIGHDAWQARFAGDPAVVGREVRLAGAVHTIVGVMPPGFRFPQSHQYWVPLRADPQAFARRAGPAIFIFGRLAPGVTMAQAQAELDAVGRRATAAWPETHATLRPMVMPYVHSLTDIQGVTTWMVVQMQLMMSLLLVVIALNVAVLVYARTATRQGEIAVRSALGASRRRIVAQLFAEALVLALVSAAAGLALAQVGLALANGIMQTELGAVPFWADYRLRPSTVLYTVGLAVLAAVIVGVLPALQATGRRLQQDLRQLGGGTGLRLGRTWTVLIVAQVAVAVAALPAAVNMGWSELRTVSTRPAFPAAEFLAAELGTEDAAGARAGDDRLARQLDELLRRVEAEPQVVGATYGASFADRRRPVEVEGLPAPATAPAGHDVHSRGVATDYLALFGARVLAGRAFGPADADGAAAAVIVNQAFVAQVLGGARALGRRVRHAGVPARAGAEAVEPSRWYEIVGVVSDLQANAMDPSLVRPQLFYPVSAAQAALAEGVSVSVRLRPGTTPADFAPRLRRLAAAVDQTLRLGSTHSLAEVERQGQLALRLVALAIGLVLVSVLLLSAAGVYALTSFTVTRRRREIGIRAALGAHPRQLLRTVFARVARQLALGVALGLAAAALLDLASDGQLLGGRGGVLLPVFGALMTLVALLAAAGPARRGLRIEPTEALRADG